MQITAIPLDKGKYFASPYIPIVGFATVLTVGTVTCVLIILSAIWLFIQAAALILASTVETLNTIGSLYTTSDPMIRLCIIAGIVFLVFYIHQLRRKKVQA